MSSMMSDYIHSYPRMHAARGGHRLDSPDGMWNTSIEVALLHGHSLDNSLSLPASP